METIKRVAFKSRFLKAIIQFFVRNTLQLIMNVMAFFVRPDYNIMVFNSFYGNRINDSPKVIYEHLKNQYISYWIVPRKNDDLKVPYRLQIKKNSLKHIYILLRANYWISNSNIEVIHGAIVPKGRRIYVNTWHGVPIKTLGSDERYLSLADRKWFRKVKFDLLCVCTDYDKEILSRVFPSVNNIVECGLPRDIGLKNISLSKINDIKKSLGVPLNKKVILYAPTFRDTDVYEDKGVDQSLSLDGLPISIKNLIQKRFFVLNRSHYALRHKAVGANDDFSIDVTQYNEINDLMLISDVLVTDYSSAMFDYSLLRKPIILFQYDFKEYTRERGMYFNPVCLGIPNYESNNELMIALSSLSLDGKDDISGVDNLRERYLPKENHSLSTINSLISKKITG